MKIRPRLYTEISCNLHTKITKANKCSHYYDTKFLQKFEMSLKNELFEHLD